MILNLERVCQNEASMFNKIHYDIKERAFILLYEYVPSLTLYDFGISRANEIFKKENFKSREIFLSIGRILGLDILLNNFDRIPFLWDNPGNPNNILFRVNLDILPVNSNFKDSQFLDLTIENSVAIDTKPICLNPNDKQQLKTLGEYLNTLQEVLKAFFYEMKNIMLFGKNLESFQFKCFDQLIDYFKNSCGILISSTNIFHISLGLICVFEDIMNIDSQNLEKLINFVQKESINMDWAKIFNTNASLLNLDYFNYIINYMKVIKEQNEEIFTWAKDVTSEYYNVAFNKVVDNVILEQINLVYNKKPKVTTSTDKLNVSSDKVGKAEPKVANSLKTSQIIANPEDDFNTNQKDAKKFSNDVHNGIFNIMDLDPGLILEVQKREYKTDKNKSSVPITDIRPESINKKKLDVTQIENLSPHHKYTTEELKDKIQRDELKQTLAIKKQLNPEEYKMIEGKIKNVDESLLADEGNKMIKSTQSNPNTKSKK